MGDHELLTAPPAIKATTRRTVAELHEENATLHAQLDGEEARWTKLEQKYRSALRVDRENLRQALLGAQVGDATAINAVFVEYDVTHPPDPAR